MDMSDLEASLKQLSEPSSLTPLAKASFPKMEKSSNITALPSMDMSDLEASLEKLSEPSSLGHDSSAKFAKMPQLDQGSSDILNMMSMTADSKIGNTKNITNKDIKKLDSLDLFSNDAAKEHN